MSISFKKTKLLLLSLVIISAFLFVSCNDSESITNKSSTVKIIGRIDPELITALSGAPVDDFTQLRVILTRMNKDGSIDRISKEVISPDKDGNFTLTTDTVDLNYAIVVAKHGGQEWKTVIEQPFKLGDTIHISSITNETTVETDVYNRLQMNKKNDMPDFRSVQNSIDPGLANSIRGNAVKIAAIAKALASGSTQQFRQLRNHSTLPVENAAIAENNTPEFSAQIHGDIHLDEITRQTLDNLVRSLDGSTRDIHLELQVDKKNNRTTAEEIVKGGLNAAQDKLWEQLKNQIVRSVKSDKKQEISFEIRLQMHA